jgi:hypothetical protein
MQVFQLLFMTSIGVHDKLLTLTSLWNYYTIIFHLGREIIFRTIKLFAAALVKLTSIIQNISELQI